MESILSYMAIYDFENLYFCQERETGLRAIIALHDTTLGPATGGCYDPFIGTDDLASVGGVPLRTYDAASPAGGAQPSISRTDCFRRKFAAWEAAGNLPSLVYMTLPNDHTRGGDPGCTRRARWSPTTTSGSAR